MNTDTMTLSERMKYYEKKSEIKFDHMKGPLIIRLDGKAFHTYTKGLEKPFDLTMARAMVFTMKALCEEMTDVIFGYTQSDEITLVLQPNSEESSPYFDFKLQKLASISSSIASYHFNTFMQRFYPDKVGYFDSRVFQVPSYYEAANCVYWRQVDAIRNSISMVAQHHFTPRELKGKNQQEMKDMLITEKGFDWDYEVSTSLKRGSSCKKINGKWDLDIDMPILKDDWDYIYEVFNIRN